MKRESEMFIATAGALFLAVLCCIGLPLIVTAVAAVGVGALFGGLGIAALIAIVAAIALAMRWRRRA